MAISQHRCAVDVAENVAAWMVYKCRAVFNPQCSFTLNPHVD